MNNEFSIQDLLDSLTMNAAIVDNDGCILYVNRSWREFAEQNDANLSVVLEGSNYFDAVNRAAEINDLYAIDFRGKLIQLLSGKIQSFDIEYPCNSHEEERWFISSMKPIGEGGKNNYLISHKNITELILRERDIKAKENLEKIGQYTSGIAHDINNLIGVFSNCFYLLEDNLSLDAKNKIFMNEGKFAIERTKALIKQLMTFAHHREIKLEPTELNVLVKEILEHIEKYLQVNVVLNKSFCDESVYIEIDYDFLVSSILNLVINAQHAIDEDGIISVSTGTRNFSGEVLPACEHPMFGHYAYIAVADNGCGIHESDMDKVLQPFYTTKKDGKGNGLGLSMIDEYMAQLQGCIAIESELNKGTTVYLYIPVIRNG